MTLLTPDELSLLERSGTVPPADVDREAACERAVARARAVLAADLHPDGIRVSVLGPAWSSDIDAHVVRSPDPTHLDAAGWVPLRSLLAAIGLPAEERWAILERGRVVMAVDLHVEPPPPQVAHVLDRCRRRGEVRVREVLELRALLKAGENFPPSDLALETAAAVEDGLGGDLLKTWLNGPALSCPATISRPVGRGLTGRAARLLSRRRFVIALSGVDGSGKSTLGSHIVEDLKAAGIPTSQVWARPGMRLGFLNRVARLARRAVGQQTSGLKEAARGGTASVPSRRGLVGWAWAFLVSVAYLGDVARQHAAATGVTIYDRHVVDATVTLDTIYAGTQLTLQKAAIRLLLPRARRAWYLAVTAEVALERKPDPLFGETIVRRQLEHYEREISAAGIARLDGTLPTAQLAEIVFREIATGRGGH